MAAEELRTIAAIAQVPDVSPAGVARAFTQLHQCGTRIETLGCLHHDKIAQAFSWKSSQMQAFAREMNAPVNRFVGFTSRGIGVISLIHESAPAWMARLRATPWMFYQGNLSVLDAPGFGFSGSRDASDWALEIARDVATEAVRHGMTVVSGGARGVDMAAHQSALAAGGTTVILVPQGLSTWRAPAPVADADQRNRMLVLTTDVPWAPWTTISAMQRNRVIVDISDVIAIPHAGTSGGSHSTGLYALGQNRDVWVGERGSDAPGNQLLLQRGAKPIPVVGGVPDIALMRSPHSVVASQQSLF